MDLLVPLGVPELLTLAAERLDATLGRLP